MWKMCLLNVNFHLIKRGKYLSISQLLLNTNITQVSVKTTTVYFPFLVS
jgi:hypothetical protein